MNKSRLIAIVDGILGNDSLCSGCQYGETKGHEEYGSCDNCRRVAADEIIEILKREDRPTGKWIVKQGSYEYIRTSWYACDQCGGAGDISDKFCKHCGAKMEV